MCMFSMLLKQSTVEILQDLHPIDMSVMEFKTVQMEVMSLTAVSYI